MHCQKANSKEPIFGRIPYIIRIGEETNSAHHDGTNMVPSKRSSVDLCERKAPAFVGIRNVGELAVEVGEGGVTAI